MYTDYQKKKMYKCSRKCTQSLYYYSRNRTIRCGSQKSMLYKHCRQAVLHHPPAPHLVIMLIWEEHPPMHLKYQCFVQNLIISDLFWLPIHDLGGLGLAVILTPHATQARQHSNTETLNLEPEAGRWTAGTIQYLCGREVEKTTTSPS